MIHIKAPSLLNTDFLDTGLRMIAARIQFPYWAAPAVGDGDSRPHSGLPLVSSIRCASAALCCSAPE